MRVKILLLVVLSAVVFVSGCVEVHVCTGSHEERIPVDPDNPLLKKRMIMLSGKLTVSSAEAVCNRLVYLNGQSSTEPIKLLINCSGGDGTAYLTTANMIKSIEAPVDTVNVGLCGSAGALLFLSGTGQRYALKHTSFIIHDPKGTPKDLTEMYIKMQEELLRTKCQVPSDWLPIKGREFVISDEEAKKYKIVDEILTKIDISQD